eukprot:jgi/Orpsp1_1/1190373/evm.model.d7180000078566.2
MKKQRESKLKENCNNFKSKKCQNFYNDYGVIADECMLDDSQENILGQEIMIEKLYGELACKNSEDNNSCPIYETILDNRNPEGVEDIILENCKYSD